MTTYLPDVNVWIALASDQHVHHMAAIKWMSRLSSDRAAFCRITELGFLRLLTNARVMGEEVRDPVSAWTLYDETRSDSRIVFLPETAGFGELWRNARGQLRGGPDVWTDAYLAVFAHHANATIVTFDRGFKVIDECNVLTLS